MNLRYCIALLWLCVAAASAQSSLPTPRDSVRIEAVVDGLDQPWSLTFLPGDAFLVTERGGRLLRFAHGRLSPVAGVPEVYARGQGGLLDVVAARDFAVSREVFLSYAKPMRGGGGTALAAARLSADGAALENLRVLFAMRHGASGGRHFGARIVEADDGMLFLSIGERGDPDKAQSLAHHHGKVIRIARDGSVPPDNPFVAAGVDAGADALPEIWSFGHRNPQGMTLDARGDLLLNEHGARGGDEVNRVRAGANYGWPVIAYGRHYWGGKIGEGASKPGMEQPLYYWDPSIAPSGMMAYSGKLWPQWRGDVFVGALKFNYIARLESSHAWREAGQIATPQTARVRDVREAPDGSIWFISASRGAIYRITPR